MGGLAGHGSKAHECSTNTVCAWAPQLCEPGPVTSQLAGVCPPPAAGGGGGVACCWQVPKLLSGSGLLRKATVILAAADALWRDTQPIISAGRQQGLCPADMFSRADVTWATSICLSRSIRLDERGGQVVLCPFADLLNHSCESKAFLTWDERQQAVVLRADRAYRPGDQVGWRLLWQDSTTQHDFVDEAPRPSLSTAHESQVQQSWAHLTSCSRRESCEPLVNTPALSSAALN